jgi:hypothetical protein
MKVLIFILGSLVGAYYNTAVLSVASTSVELLTKLVEYCLTIPAIMV